MDVGQSFRYVFDDKKWVSKLLIGLLVSIVPILNFAWNGYLVRLLNRVSAREEEPLPEWDEFGDKWVKGLILFVVGLIYAIPVVILVIIAAMGGVAVGTSTGDVQDIVGGIFAGVGILFTCLISLYLLGLTFYMPAVYIHFSRKEDFGACFEIGKIIDLIRENIGEYLTAWVVTVLFGLVLGVVAAVLFTILSVIPCIGWILEVILMGFLVVWPSTVFAHLFGQVGALSPVSITPQEPDVPGSDLQE